MAPIEALDNLKGSLSKGSSLKRYSYSLPLQNKPKKLKNLFLHIDCVFSQNTGQGETVLHISRSDDGN